MGKFFSQSTSYKFDRRIRTAIISVEVLAKDPNLAVQFICSVTLSIAVSFSATLYMGLATLAFAFLSIGLLNRRYRARHVFFMNAGIALDLGIVLALEFQRNAIATAVGFTLSPFQQAHIGASSIATALYIPILILGWKRYRGSSNLSIRTWHMRLGLTAFIFRTLGFVLMFALLGRHTVGE